MTTFGDYLQNKLGSHNPEEIEELILDDVIEKTESLTEAQKTDLEKYSKLIHLSLANIGFVNLKNFPKLPNLQVLELHENNLTGEDLGDLVELYPQLAKLRLTKNNIKSADCLKPLNKLTLKKIYVKDNPFIQGDEKYRENLFKMFSHLVAVDGLDKEGKDVESTDYVGEGEEDDDQDEFDEDDDEEEEEVEEFEDEEEEEDDEEEEPKPVKKQKKH